jgi:hypothetical protein
MVFAVTATPDRAARADGLQCFESLPLDDAAAGLGLAPLRNAAPAPEERELRLWVDYGHPSGSYLLRLRTAAGTVDGELIAWRRNGAEIRTRDVIQPTDWTRVLHELEAHSAWTLPSEPALPPPQAVSTCLSPPQPIALLVEARTDAGYRSYRYETRFRALPADRSNVKAIIDLVHGLANHRPEQIVHLPGSGCG